MLNDWNEKEIKRFERVWGRKFPRFLLNMFNFTIIGNRSYLDLGCGFGRFLQFLENNVDEPDYVGYDSSKAMINRIRKRFPDFFIRTFHRDITKPITHPQEAIISSAVFIHLTNEEQHQILDNILKLRPLPKSITFDINCPGQDRSKLKQSDFIEEISKYNFRLVWQSPSKMLETLNSKFSNSYSISSKRYSMRKPNFKTVFFLKRKS